MTPALGAPLLCRRLAAWAAALALAAGAALLATRVSPMALAAAPILVAGGLVALRWPWLGVVALIASVPVQQAGAIGGGGVTLTATRASLPLALATLILLWTGARQPVKGSLLVVPLVALLGWMLVTAHVASDTGEAAAELFRWSVALFALLAAIQIMVGATERALTIIVAVVGVAGAIEAFFGLTLGVLGIGPESFVVADAFARAYGTFGRPNTFAGYLEIALFPVLWLGLYRIRRIRSDARTYVSARRTGFSASAAERQGLAGSVLVAGVLIVSAAVMLGGILISFSRGAWIGVAAGLAVSVAVASRRHWHLVAPAAPALALAVIGALFALAPATLTARIGSIADEARPFDAASVTLDDDNFAVVERMAHWQAGWRMFEDHPLTGVGVGNFNARYPDYFVREEFRRSQGHAHNYYIHTLAETGVVGLALYLVVALSFLMVALQVAMTSADRLAGALALGALGSLVAVAVHNGFENLHVLNLGIQISATWALALAAHARAGNARRAEAVSDVEYSRK